jgi:hypothetical protein
MTQKISLWAFLIIILCTVMVDFGLASRDDSKIQMFAGQYKALKVESDYMWKKIVNVDMTKNIALDDMSSQTLNLIKRINRFSEGIQEYSIDQRNRGTINADDVHKIQMLANTADAMSQTLSVGLTYLMIQKGIYLQTALKYREIWVFVEREAEIR